MNHDEASLTRVLIERGVLARSAGPVPSSDTQRPWFISALLGVAGWLAGLFVLVFASLLFKPDDAVEIAPIGLVLIAAAFGLYAVDKESAFFDQLALALSIAGQCALIWAAADATKSNAGTAALTLVLQLILLVVMPNGLAKVLAAFFACVAWALTMRLLTAGDAGLWGQALNASRSSTLIAWLIVWTPLVIAAEALIRTEISWVATRYRDTGRALLTGVLASLSIAAWLTEPFASLAFAGVPHGSKWFALWPLLGALMALFAALCAFRIRSRALMGLAIAGALLHIAHFYYLLGTTLLIKSCLMILVGAALLMASMRLQRKPQ